MHCYKFIAFICLLVQIALVVFARSIITDPKQPELLKILQGGLIATNVIFAGVNINTILS